MVGKSRSIELQGLKIDFSLPRGGSLSIVRGVDFAFEAGRVTCIVGESGCGKSVLGQAVLGALPAGVLVQGRVLCGGQNVLVPEERPADYYGRIMGVVPQNPSESLNPVRRLSSQFRDVLEAAGLPYREEDVLQQLALFGIADGARILSAYPHELSGGLQQRVLCAMAVITEPEWILADEPTKGLDEVVGRVVLENLKKIKARQACGMIIITHDLELAEQLGDTVAVMYAGQILEAGSEVLRGPRHPYTRALLAALPANGFQTLPGIAPRPGEVLSGCCFAPRCRECREKCLQQSPPEVRLQQGSVRCWQYA